MFVVFLHRSKLLLDEDNSPRNAKDDVRLYDPFFQIAPLLLLAGTRAMLDWGMPGIIIQCFTGGLLR